MAPNLTDDEIDDLVYLARVGENKDLTETLSTLAEREKTTPADVLLAAKDEGKSTCLHMATGNGHLETVRLLLTHFTAEGVSREQRQGFLDAQNEYGNTGLHWAALGGLLDTVKVLVDHGASSAIANDKDQIPLDLAVFSNRGDVTEYFLSQSGGMESENAAGADGTNGGLEAAAAGVELEGEEAEEVKQGEDGAGRT